MRMFYLRSQENGGIGFHCEGNVQPATGPAPLPPNAAGRAQLVSRAANGHLKFSQLCNDMVSMDVARPSSAAPENHAPFPTHQGGCHQPT